MPGARGCQDDGKEPTSGASGSCDVLAERRAPTEAPAAGGPAIKGDIFTVNVPEGWTKDKDFSTDFLDQYSDAGRSRTAVRRRDRAGEVRPLDEVAKDNFTCFATDRHQAQARRPATLAGDPAYHFTADDGVGDFAEEFLVVHDGSR